MDPGSAQYILKHTFGYDSFRGLQQQVIDHVVGGGDALVLMPTGGGKSVTYQIPALMRRGVGVLVWPLIALMQNQVATLEEVGVRAAFLNSTLSSADAAGVERALRAGDLDLVYVAPEQVVLGTLKAGLPISVNWEDCSAGVYNIEKVDQDITQALVPSAALTTVWRGELLGGVTVIMGRFAEGSPLVAIPNYARYNREPAPPLAPAVPPPVAAPPAGAGAGTAPRPVPRPPTSIIWMREA